MKIMLVGGCLAGNMGGDAMYETYIDQIKKVYPECEIVVMTKYPNDEISICKERGYSVYSFTTIQRLLYGIPFWMSKGRIKPKHLSSTLSQYSECDLIADFSGISFSDYRSFPDLLINSSWFLPAFVTGTPIIKMSQSLGPYKKITTYIFAKYCLKRINIVVARGNESYKVTKDLLPNKEEIINLPDVAICLNPSGESEKSKILSKIGINEEPYITMAPSVVVNERFGKERYEELFEEIILMVSEKMKMPIVFVPHTRNLSKALGVDSASDDLDICCNIANRQALKDVDIRIIRDKYNARELKSVIGASEIAIGSRYHFLVAALSSGVPAVALGWGHKYMDLFEIFDMQKFAFEYHNFIPCNILITVNDLIEFKNELRKKINVRLPEIKNRSEMNSQIAFRLLQGEMK